MMTKSNRILNTISITTLFALPMSIGNASYTCSPNASIAEWHICADSELLALDGEMEKFYNMNLEVAEGKLHSQLIQTQAQWLKKRNQCKTKECVKKTYKQRIYWLEEQING